MVPADVLHWLATQYPDEYEKAVPGDLVNGQQTDAERKLLEHITKELAKATQDGPDDRAPGRRPARRAAQGLHLRPGRPPGGEVRPDDGVPAGEPEPDRGRRGRRRGAAAGPAPGALRHEDQREHRRRAPGQRPAGRHARAQDRQHADGQPRDPPVQGGPQARQEPRRCSRRAARWSTSRCPTTSST